MTSRFELSRRVKRQTVANIQGLTALVALGLIIYPSTGTTELVNNGDGTIIDTDLQVMWVQDLNYAVTTRFDTDGLLTYQSAQMFVDAMNAGTVPNFGFTDWRLPTTLIPDPSCDTLPSLGIGFYCSGSEMGHLYYVELGLLPLQFGTPTSHLPFFNLRGIYWSSTEQTPGQSAMVFGLLGGNQFVADETIEVAVLPVRDIGTLESEIDIKPGSSRNPINLKSNGNIPVAILTSGTFDATQVNWETVRFGPSGATERHQRVHVKDTDYDGDMDVVLHFKTRDTGILCGDTEATLTGESFSGEEFTGSDVIKIVKCPKQKRR